MHKKTDQDTDEEIDIDDDGTEEFGESQYNEQNLSMFRAANDSESDHNDSNHQLLEDTTERHGRYVLRELNASTTAFSWLILHSWKCRRGL